MNVLARLAVIAVATFIATAYGPPWDSMNGSGVTATGIKLPAGPTGAAGPYLIAVDPSVIPLGTRVRITPNPFGDPNIVFQAADTGGAIKGNRIDILDMRGRAAQLGWGRRPVSLTVVGKGPASISSAQPTVNPATSGGTSPPSAPSSGSGFTGVLLDGVLIVLGAALVVRGTEQALGMEKGGLIHKAAAVAAVVPK